MRKHDLTNKKTTTMTHTKTKTMTMTMLNTFREHLQSLRLLTFEKFAQSDEKTWPDQQKTTTKTKTNTKTTTNTFKEHLQRAIFETCGL